MEREIILNINRKEIEKFFFSKSEGNFLKGKQVIEPLIYWVGFVGILLILFLFNAFEKVPWLFYVLFFPSTLLYLGKYTSEVRKKYKYKKSIIKWLDYIDTFKICKLNLSENSITLSMDQEVTIQKWSSIYYCTLNEKRILLQGEQQFFLPSSAMKEEEYIFLKETINKKLSQEVMDPE